MIKRIIYKFIVLTLIIGLNWFGVLIVIDAMAYYDDIEQSDNSRFAAGILDFSLKEVSNFNSQVTPSTVSEKSFKLKNEGSTDIKYDSSIAVTNSGLCSELNLEVIRNDAPIYNGLLSGYNLSNLNLILSLFVISLIQSSRSSRSTRPSGVWSKIA